MIDSSKFIIFRPVCKRPAILKFCLEFQEKITGYENYSTYFSLDKSQNDTNYFLEKNLEVIDNFKGKKIINIRDTNHDYMCINANGFETLKYLFNELGYEYVLFTEEDVILSKDFLEICEKIIEMKWLEEKGISGFFAGELTWGRGDSSRITSTIDNNLRAFLFNKTFFNENLLQHCHEEFYNLKTIFNYSQSFFGKEALPIEIIPGGDTTVYLINRYLGFKSLCPEACRYTHVGFYGYTVGDKNSLAKLSFDEQYKLLQLNYTQASSLKSIAGEVNPDYFGDFVFEQSHGELVKGY